MDVDEKWAYFRVSADEGSALTRVDTESRE